MTTPAIADQDVVHMRAALEHARKGSPSPNPQVGAVVVKDDAIIAAGHHAQAGGPHAEVVALNEAQGNTAGATLYVTLEPCNHHGRTPPCTEAIIASKVRRVVIGCHDPNPHVTGRGAERLRAAGIEVAVGVAQAEAEQLIRPWRKHITSGLPYVSLKLALSLDGRIATRTGASKWVTGSVARAKVHALRGEQDAVGVGIGTAVADDPRLTVRDVPGKTPTRIVFDTNLRVPVESRLVTSAAQFPTWVVCGEDADATREATLRDHGVVVLRSTRSTEGRLDIRDAMTLLAERGIVRLMLEGGAELAGSILATQLADEMHAFLAPILLGPRGRPGAVDWAGPATPKEAPRIEAPSWELVGEDAYVHGRIRYGEE